MWQDGSDLCGLFADMSTFMTLAILLLVATLISTATGRYNLFVSSDHLQSVGNRFTGLTLTARG